MARELADVLHHFLGESASAEPRAAASLALVSEPDDAFAVAFAWNLAHELARQGAAVAWVTGSADEELLPAELSPGLTRLFAPGRDLSSLARAASEADAKLAASRAPGVVLARVPPAWIVPGPAADTLLARTLQLVTPDAEHASRLVTTGRRLFDAAPAACLGATLHGVRSVREAERAFTAFARACVERSDLRPTSYGVLLEDAAFYRSLLARRPLSELWPDSRAAHALADVAGLVRADLQADAR